MQIYQVGLDVTVSAPLTDYAGNALTPTGLSWRLLDEMDEELIPATAVPLPATSPLSITVPGSYNTLPLSVSPNPLPIMSGARTVELSITTAGGTIITRMIYGIQVAVKLQILVNSFQTFAQAEVEAALMSDLSGGYAAAAPDKKIMALSEAYRRLTRFGYFVRWPRDPDAQNTISWWNVRNTMIPARFWQFMKMDRFLTYYPEDFRSALRKAQVSEADHILTKDPAADRRISGIVSEEIGQSKVAFRRDRPLDLGISKRTMGYLDGYLNIRATLTRS
jgi:hypothetical protein